MLHFLIVLFCFASISSKLYSQTTASFEKYYGNKSTSDIGNSVIELSDGNLLFVGTTVNFGAEQSDIYLVKTDFEGNELWSKIYGTEMNETGIAVQELEDGSLMIIGNRDTLIETSNNSHYINFQGFLIKIDFEGNELWSKVLDSNRSLFELVDMVYSTSGNLLIAGVYSSYSFLIEVNKEGEIIWETEQIFGDIREFKSIKELSDGSFIVVASERTWMSPNTIFKPSIIKISSDGELEWTHIAEEMGGWKGEDVWIRGDGTHAILANSLEQSNEVLIVVLDESGNQLWAEKYAVEGGQKVRGIGLFESVDKELMIVGNILVKGSKEEDVFTILLSSDGTNISEEIYDYNGQNLAEGLMKHSNGDVLIVGASTGFGGTGKDVLGLCLSKEGSVVWQTTYGELGGADTDRGMGLLQLPDGGYLISGHSNSYNSRGDLDAYLLRLDENGAAQWTQILDFSNGEDFCYQILALNNGGYVLWGENENEDGELYPQLTWIDETGNLLGVKQLDNGVDWSETNGIVLTENNEFMVCGRKIIEGDAVSYYAKLDAQGEMLWGKTAEGTRLKSIQATLKGGYLMVGSGAWSSSDGYVVPMQIIKINGNGVEEWSKTHGSGALMSTTYKYAFDVRETMTGDFIVSGYYFFDGSSGSTIYKFDRLGNFLWDNHIDAGREEYTNTFIADGRGSDGFCFVGNLNNGYQSLLPKSFLYKTDVNGNKEWVNYYGENMYESPNLTQALRTQDGGYAAVGTMTIDNSDQIFFVKTAPSGENEIVNTFESNQGSLLLCPTPARSSVRVSFENNYTGTAELKVFDTTGRLIFTDSKLKNDSIYSNFLDVSSFAKGIYFVEIAIG
ncbi:MAG: T9SS type A sorting domain-containing protein, partial [Chitinophagales bacterium]